MQKLPKPVKPTYSIGSVDRALRLIQILRDRGEVRLRSAAAELGVSESTVHRLMAMLVYRGFAVQDESRAYHPGPAAGAGLTGAGLPGAGRTDDLIMAARSHMTVLSRETGETSTLLMRAGTQAHVLWSEEGHAPQHVISRAGAIFPVVSTAGGLMLMSGLAEDQVRALCESLVPGGMPSAEVEALIGRVRLHRRSGYATAVEGAEREVCGVCVALHDADGRGVAALGLAVPSSRFDRSGVLGLVRSVRMAQLDIERDLLDRQWRVPEGDSRPAGPA